MKFMIMVKEDGRQYDKICVTAADAASAIKNASAWTCYDDLIDPEFSAIETATRNPQGEERLLAVVAEFLAGACADLPSFNRAAVRSAQTLVIPPHIASYIRNLVETARAKNPARPATIDLTRRCANYRELIGKNDLSAWDFPLALIRRACLEAGPEPVRPA